MARRKRRGGRRGGLPKIVGKVGRMGASAVQVIGALYPLWQGVLDHRGDPQNIPAGIIYRGSGYDINTGNWNQTQAVTTVAVIGGSLVIGKLIKYALKGV